MKFKLTFVSFIIVFLLVVTSVNAINIKKDIDYSLNSSLDISVACFNSPEIKIIYSDDANPYTNYQSYYLDGSLTDLISEDFNKDGLSDLASTNRLNGQVDVLLQNSEGGFTNKDSYAVGVGPHTMTSGFFNDDEYIDLAVINQGGEGIWQYSISVLFNDGAGDFSHSKSYQLPSIPNDITSGDFNGDGAIDLAVSTYLIDKVHIFLNKNNEVGDYYYHTSLVTGEKPYGVASGDFNADGLADLAVGNYQSGTVSIFLANPSQTSFFDEKVDYDVLVHADKIVVGYFDDDHYLDIAATGGYYINAVNILFNDNGDGFKPNYTYGIPYSGSMNIVSEDINGDGLSDLATTSIEGGICLFFSDSDGKFTKIPLEESKIPCWGIAIGDFGEWENQAPEKPTITASEEGINGETGTEYEYIFSSIDPNGDDVQFFVEWGDETDFLTALCDNSITVKKTWAEQGTYIIKAKSIDEYGYESDWTKLTITMPKSKGKILDRFNLIFPDLFAMLKNF